MNIIPMTFHLLFFLFFPVSILVHILSISCHFSFSGSVALWTDYGSLFGLSDAVGESRAAGASLLFGWEARESRELGRNTRTQLASLFFDC